MGSDLVVADAAGTHVAATLAAPVTHVDASPCGGFVAAYASDGRLGVWPADFGRQLSEFATQADSPPIDVGWCGADSVVLLWEVGDEGDGGGGRADWRG